MKHHTIPLKYLHQPEEMPDPVCEWCRHCAYLNKGARCQVTGMFIDIADDACDAFDPIKDRY